MVGNDLRGLFRDGTATGLGEGPLLDRFVSRGDAAAFAALVARHGPMVWGVCRRALHDPNDAEDAFQATFLVLARRAGKIRRRDRLGGWLHGVACKVAARARCERRRDATRRAEPGAEPAVPAADDPAEARERAALLHEEIDRLPDKYREPVVLCHLEGCTHDEAAARLGWPVGTVRGRLARGRDRLRDRLARRGLGVPAVLPPIIVPEVLAEITVRAATACRSAAIAGAPLALSARGAEWAEGVQHAMFTSQIKTFAAATLAAGLLVAGAGALAIGQTRKGDNNAGLPPIARSASTSGDRSNEEARDLEPLGRETPEAIARVDSQTEAEKFERRREEERDKLILTISETEPDVDVLQMKVDAERGQIEELTRRLIALKSPDSMRFARPPSKEEKEAHDRFVDDLKSSVEDLRRQYIRDRGELTRLELRLQNAKSDLSSLRRPGAESSPPDQERRSPRGRAAPRPSPGAESSPPDLERRLSAIESKLDELLNEVKRSRK
jgi:RNA polymerase sigma factor (sigma-70 family)